MYVKDKILITVFVIAALVFLFIHTLGYAIDNKFLYDFGFYSGVALASLIGGSILMRLWLKYGENE